MWARWRRFWGCRSTRSAKLREVGHAAQGEVCQAANINSPEQIVISGHAGAVGRAIQLATERGAKKAVSLPVSAPFHCSLMQPAQDRLAARPERAEFSESVVPGGLQC